MYIPLSEFSIQMHVYGGGTTFLGLKKNLVISYNLFTYKSLTTAVVRELDKKKLKITFLWFILIK